MEIEIIKEGDGDDENLDNVLDATEDSRQHRGYDTVRWNIFVY